MSTKHAAGGSPTMAEPVTYTGKPTVTPYVLRCSRCKREHPFPAPGAKPVRCECGWWYTNVNGTIQEEFRPRLSG